LRRSPCKLPFFVTQEHNAVICFLSLPSKQASIFYPYCGTIYPTDNFIGQ
jgi:hypothetical protein